MRTKGREAPMFLACFSPSLEEPCSLGEAEGRALSAEGSAGYKARRGMASRSWDEFEEQLVNVGCRNELVRHQGPKEKLIACEGSV